MQLTKDENRKLVEKYPFLKPKSRWTGKVREDYDYERTELDNMPDGWRIAFGEEMCAELKVIIEKHGAMEEYAILDIKEKYGELCWYFIGKEMTWREYYKHFVHVVNYDEAVRSRIKKDRPFKYQGYVYKHLIAAFEVGEEDIHYWLSRDEYEAMSEQEQKEYAWYEWNDYDGEYGILYDIYTMVENLLGWYRQNALFKSKQYNYEDFIASNVRLIIYMS